MCIIIEETIQCNSCWLEVPEHLMGDIECVYCEDARQIDKEDNLKENKNV